MFVILDTISVLANNFEKDPVPSNNDLTRLENTG